MHARFLGKQIPLRVVPRRRPRPRRRRRRNGLLLLFLFRPRPIDDGDATLDCLFALHLHSQPSIDYQSSLASRHLFLKSLPRFLLSMHDLRCSHLSIVSLLLTFSLASTDARMEGKHAGKPRRVGDGFYPMRPNGVRSRSTD